jgi:hypothetical protein
LIKRCKLNTRKDHAIKTLCEKTLENGGGINRYLRSDVIITLGGNVVGLKKRLNITYVNT